MKARVKWVEQVSFLGETESNHAILMDGSPAAGGRNLGPRPMETVLAGTGAYEFAKSGAYSNSPHTSFVTDKPAKCKTMIKFRDIK